MFSAKFVRFSALKGSEISSTFGRRYFSAGAVRHGAPIGFIGLGNMGTHMARNLVKNGNEVLVYDVIPDNVKSVTDAGAKSGSSPAEIASNTTTIVTMLPASPHVRQVYTGDKGILSSVQTGSLLIDSSTIDPSVSQEMETLSKEKGATYMDAPVSGGVNAARDAILTFMVGGSADGYSRAEAVLKQMGKNVVHTGHCGTGQAAKICNNMLLGISMIGTSEAMNLGIKLGLDPKMLAKILNMSSGRCWSSEVYNPCPGVLDGVPSSNQYKGGFGTALMTKDLGLAQNAATQTASPTPMGSLAHQMYRIMCQSGYGLNDFSSAFKFLQDQQEKK